MKLGIIISKVFEERFKLRYKELLLKNNIPFHEIDKLPHFLTNEDADKIDADFLIVLGIHTLSDKPKRLCVHPCGNWNKKWHLYSNKNLGGEEKSLSMCSGALLKQIYHLLLKCSNISDYGVNIECTHHGPSLNKPIIFLEIGCSPKEWQDKKAKKVILKVLKKIKPSDKGETAIVLGGDHYMRHISFLLRKTNIQVSHMCSSSHLHCFNQSMLNEAMNKSYEKIDYAIIDLVRVGQHKNRIINILEKNNVPYKYLHKLVRRPLFSF